MITDKKGREVKEGDTIVFSNTSIPYKVIKKNGILGAYEKDEFISLQVVLKNYVITNR